MSNLERFQQLHSQLGDLAKRAEALGGNYVVSISEALSNSFMAQHTVFASADEMFKASEFDIETHEDLAAIPEQEWNNYIRSISVFDDWQSMLGKAGKEWIKSKLGL